MTQIEILSKDISKLEVDAIVNAANNSLLGGGGVDGAIHRAAGSELLEACKQLNGCETGKAKITKGFKLPAKYVIHAVGPVWKGGYSEEKGLLKSAYYSALDLTKEYDIKSIAFPNISTGIYGFPKIDAAKIVFEIIKEVQRANLYPNLEKIVFSILDEENHIIYTNYYKLYF